MIELAPNNPYGLTLAAPVMTAAGCFGFGVEYARTVPIERIGAVVTRPVALRPRDNGAPRLIETPSGLLCVGPWPARSLSSVLGRYPSVWAGWHTPVLLSVAGDYAAVAGALEGVEGVAGLELTVEEPGEAAKATAAARAVTLLPLLVKIPVHDGLVETARAVAGAGADAITVAPPQRATAPDPISGELLTGRLVGPAVRPLTLRAIAEVCAAVTIPVIGSGGVSSAADARGYLAAGAAAVQIGSALLSDPWAAGQIAAELAG